MTAGLRTDQRVRFWLPSEAALDFVNTEAKRKESASEFVALGTVSGDFSQLFELPGSPVAFALGASIGPRRRTASLMS